MVITAYKTWKRLNTVRKGSNNKNYTNKEQAVSQFRVFLFCSGKEKKKQNIGGTVMLRICCMGEIEWRLAMRSAYIILVKDLERK